MPKKRPTHHLKMVVLPEKPDEKKWAITVWDDAPSGAMFIQSANGRLILHCGACNRSLMKLDSVSQVQGGAWKCPDCGAYNTTIQ